jgi:hypothetical protein
MKMLSGVYRRDLIYHSESEVKGGDTIDFGKKKIVYNIIMEIQKFQHKSYNFPVNPEIYSILRVLPQPESNFTVDIMTDCIHCRWHGS